MYRAECAAHHSHTLSPPHLIIQLLVQLGQLCLTLVLLHICEANAGDVGRGGRLVVKYVVQGEHLGVGLLLVELLLHWDTLTCGGSTHTFSNDTKIITAPPCTTTTEARQTFCSSL